MSKFKPCPFCGNTEPDFHTDDHGDNWWVTCQECEADGPVRDYRCKLPKEQADEALIEAWNKRPINAELLAACREIAASGISHKGRGYVEIQVATEALDDINALVKAAEVSDET